MRRTAILAVTIIAIIALIAGISTAMAAKPQNAGNKGMDVIEKSNGFPSGKHFNLNIHGKNDDYQCDASSGGNSVFIREYGTSTLQYISNKKAKVYELTVLDKCAEYFDGDPAKIQLPYKIQLDDGSIVPAEGYYVFGRILAKPNNGKSGNESSIILYPNDVVAACNDPGNPDFGNLTECPDDPLLALGLIVGDNLYTAEPEAYVRFDPGNTGGKGKSKATDITRLFTYTGWVVNPILDLNDNGVMDAGDVPGNATAIVIAAGGVVADYDQGPFGNNNGVIDTIEEWLDFQQDQVPQMAWYFFEEWVFEIADLVITEQGLVNDGTKLLQIRFYPRATTEFTPK
jgi:hypothetical protein